MGPGETASFVGLTSVNSGLKLFFSQQHQVPLLAPLHGSFWQASQIKIHAPRLRLQHRYQAFELPSPVRQNCGCIRGRRVRRGRIGPVKVFPVLRSCLLIVAPVDQLLRSGSCRRNRVVAPGLLAWGRRSDQRAEFPRTFPSFKADAMAWYSFKYRDQGVTAFMDEWSAPFLLHLFFPIFHVLNRFAPTLGYHSRPSD